MTTGWLMLVETLALVLPVGGPEVRGPIVAGALDGEAKPSCSMTHALRGLMSAPGLQYLSPEAVRCKRLALPRGVSGFEDQSPWLTTALLLGGGV